MIHLVKLNNTKLIITTFDELINLSSDDIKQIIAIDCSYNNLIEIPKDISKLYNLKYFDCSHNNLKEIPIEICNLRNLIDINCSFNEINLIPIELSKLKKLDTIICYNTNIENIPNEIILSRIKIRKNKYFNLYKLH